MENNGQIEGSKQALQNMLYYYAISLKESGIKDVKQKIATDIGSMIELSEEQINFVIDSMTSKNKTSDNLENCIKLLESMKKTNKIDIESMNIIIPILTIMKDDYIKISSGTLDDLDFGDIDNG